MSEKLRITMRLGIDTINKLTDGAHTCDVDRSAYLQSILERSLQSGLPRRADVATLCDALGRTRERTVFKLDGAVVAKVDRLAARLGISRTLWAILSVAR